MWQRIAGRVAAVLLGILTAPGVVTAQVSSIQGRVVDGETGAPLSAVEITVAIPGDASLRSGGLSDSRGSFRIPNVPAGSYELGFRRLGYGTSEMLIQVRGETPADVGTVQLQPEAVALEAVEVVAERPAVVYAPDRDIYSVEAIAGAAGGSVTDVLAGIPDLEVDVNGAVTMRGAAPTIYINGRPAPMEGESLDAFLAQFPADALETVEVMANPSARYEAEGGGGIVNIVLRRDARLGLNGSVFANGGSRGDRGLGGRATFQDGPLTLMGGSSLRMNQRETESKETRQNLAADPITFLEQDALSDRSSWSANIDLSGEYALGENTTLSAETRLVRNAADSDRITTYTELDAERLITEQYDRTAVDDSQGLSGDFAVELEHGFGGDDHEISAEFQVERGSDSEESLVRQRLLEDDALAEGIELTWDDAREHDTEVSFRSDYLRHWGGSGQLEFGLRSELGETDERQARQIGIEGVVDDLYDAPTTGFSHSQAVTSLYLSAMQRRGELSGQLGVRAERTSSDFRLPGDPAAYRNDYTSFFPNANLSYDFAEGKRVRMAYSVRVRRPSANILNPTNRSTDPLNRRVGNPGIEPSYTHSMNIDLSWTGELGNLRFSPFYRRSVNEWEQIKTIDASGVTTSTWENLAGSESYGSSISASVREYKGFGGSLNFSGQREVRDWSGLLEEAPRSTMRWSMRANLNSRVAENTNVQTSLRYSPPRDLPQGRSSSTVMTTVSVRQRLFERRATLSLNVRDPLGIYRSSTRLNDANLIEVGEQRSDERRISLSLSYAFGGQEARSGRGRGFGGGGGRR